MQFQIELYKYNQLTNDFYNFPSMQTCFHFFYNISKIQNTDKLMTHCKDLQLTLASDDSSTSDINAVELQDGITALQRLFNATETNP